MREGKALYMLQKVRPSEKSDCSGILALSKDFLFIKGRRKRNMKDWHDKQRI